MKKFLLCLALALLMTMGVSALADEASIPVISLDGDCLIGYTSWTDKSAYCPVTLTYTDGDYTYTQEIQLKPQGKTTLYAPKKNFTIKFSQGVEMKEEWGAHKKYVLKADYIDPTCSCNVVSAKLVAEMNAKYGVFAGTPNYGVTDGFPVWVKINGEDAGVYSMTIPKEEWMFGMDKNNPNHLVLACEDWTESGRMQTAEIDYELEWTFEVGDPTDENKAAFERLVTFVSTADDATFVRDFDQYLDLDACLNYICFINVAYANDNVSKNMLMVTYDGKVWYPTLYDLDSLWGVGYDGKRLAEPDGVWSEKLLSDGQMLLYRVTRLFSNQLRQRYWELRETVLSKEHVLETYAAYMAQIPQEYYDINNALWNPNGDHIRSLEMMEQLMDQYQPIIDNLFAEPVAKKTAAETKTAAPQTEKVVASGTSNIHYVWETNGVRQYPQSMDELPVTVRFAYTLDGVKMTAEEVAGKSGRLEITLDVERNTSADYIYGVAAMVNVQQAQCHNVAVAGGSYLSAAQEYAFVGNAWLGGTSNSYRMQLIMDVTAFDPAKFTVLATPLYVGGGEDNSLTPLLNTAGQLSDILTEGITLYDYLVEKLGYLNTTMTSITSINTLVQGLLPAEDQPVLENPLSIMQTLLADAEMDADTLLAELGFEVTGEIKSDARLNMLHEVMDNAENSEMDRAHASMLVDLIEDYMIVEEHLRKTDTVINSIASSLSYLDKNLPLVIDAYSYANNYLYSILVDIRTLYTDLVNYYNSNKGGGGYDVKSVVDNFEVIIYTNHEEIPAL